jgi:SPP1 gp7 family putative phage head morphogenesis protein
MQTLESPGYVSKLTRIREQYEASYIRKFNGIQEERFNYVAEILTKQGLQATLKVQSLGFDLVFRDMLVQFMREWINVGQNHGMNEIQLQLSMAEKWSSPFNKGINNANSYYDAYAVKLAGMTDQSLLKKTQDIIKEGIKSGETTKATIKRLEGLYPSFSKTRLENIVRTESGKCYNWGRLNTFYQNSDVVEGVRFSAILDGRTTDICIARNGLILPLTDQAGIASNTPPLHYQCRSIWTPVAIGQIGKKYSYNQDQYKPIMEKMPPMDGFGYQDLSGITKTKSTVPVSTMVKIGKKQEGHASDEWMQARDKARIQGDDIAIRKEIKYLRDSGITGTDQELEQMISTIKNYSHTSYRDYRNAFKDPSRYMTATMQNNIDTIERFLEQAPTFNQPIYRGVSMSQDIALKRGGTISMRGLSSWSSDLGTAQSFTCMYGEREGYRKVIFKCVTPPKRASSIKHLSLLHKENEVLVSSKVQFRILRISKEKVTIYDTVHDILVVLMESIS